MEVLIGCRGLQARDVFYFSCLLGVVRNRHFSSFAIRLIE